MNIRFALVAIAAFVALPVAAQETYIIDPVHSQPQWETRHVNFSTQRGSFQKMTGKVVLDRTAKKGSIDVTIDASSIRTYNDRLDAVVKGERYFNVEKYPTITFKSDNLKFDGDQLVGAEGALTMLGVTKPVTLVVTNFRCGEDPFKKRPMCGADGVATIKRTDWGMNFGVQINNPADEVKLLLPVEAYRDQA